MPRQPRVFTPLPSKRPPARRMCMYIIVYVYYYIMYLLYIYTICIAYLHWRYTIFSQLLDHKSHTPLLFSLYNGHLRTGPTKVVRCNVIAAAFYPLAVYKCNRVYSVCDETTTAYALFLSHGSDPGNRISTATRGT